MIKTFDDFFIKKRIIYYKVLLKKTTNQKKRKLIEEAITSLQIFYNEFYGHTSSQKRNFSMRAVELDDKGILSIYKDFLPYIYQVYEGVFAQDKSKENFYQLQYINTKKDKIISTTKDFYNNIGDVFAKKTNFLYENKKIHISFYKCIDNDTISALTYKVKNFDEIYIRIGLQNSIEDYLSSFHEHSHAISSLINSEHIESDFQKCLSEVDSYFFELVGLDYLKNNGVSQNDIDNYLINFGEFIRNVTNFIIGKNIIYKKDDINKIHSVDEIANIYIKILGYDKESAVNMAMSELRNYIAYLTSALVAVELYLQYKTDNNLALENLKKIINLKRYNFIEYIKELEKMKIIPGEHFIDFYNIVNKKKDNISLKKQH